MLFYVTIQPQSSLKKNLKNLGIKTVTNSSKIIRNLIDNKNNYIKSRAMIYVIPCLDCNKKYVGGSGCYLKKQIYKQIGDLKKGNINNYSVRHNSRPNHFSFKDSKKLVYIHKKNTRKLLNLVSF